MKEAVEGLGANDGDQSRANDMGNRFSEPRWVNFSGMVVEGSVSDAASARAVA